MRNLASIVALLALTLVAARAQGTEYRSGGNACQGNDEDLDLVGHQWGDIYNYDTANAAAFECPVSNFTITSAASVSAAKVFYHEGALTGLNGVYCFMTGKNETGSYWQSSVLYSRGTTAGGCGSFQRRLLLLDEPAVRSDVGSSFR
jgi:hypothetical protein